MGENDNAGTAFCIHCGTEIAADATFCPECGSSQDPESVTPDAESAASQEATDSSQEESGFTSWAIGFEPGQTGRNFVVGLLYILFAGIGIILLVYAYLVSHPGKGKYFAWGGGLFLILAGLGFLTDGTTRGIAAGVLAVALGLFFLPLLREKLGIGAVPGINGGNSQRRNVLIGIGYGIGSLVAIGAVAPETETADSAATTAGTTDEENSGSQSGGSDGGGGGSSDSQSLEEQYPDAYAVDPSTGMVILSAEGSADEFSVSIEGEAVNESDNDYDYVGIEFGLYDDSGAKVGDALDNVSGLSAGGRWRYEAIGTGEGASSFQLEDITAF